jgi:hypothetical protein
MFFLVRWRDYQGMVLMRPRRMMRARVSERATAHASRERVRRGVMEVLLRREREQRPRGLVWGLQRGWNGISGNNRKGP